MPRNPFSCSGVECRRAVHERLVHPWSLAFEPTPIAGAAVALGFLAAWFLLLPAPRADFARAPPEGGREWIRPVRARYSPKGCNCIAPSLVEKCYSV